MNDYLVTLSGGPDSTTAAYWANEQGYDLRAITVDYGQRAREQEIDSAKQVASDLDIPHTIVPIEGLQNALDNLTQGAALLSVSWHTDSAPFGSSIIHSIAAVNSLCVEADGVIYSTHEGDRDAANPNTVQYQRNFLDKYEELVEFGTGKEFEIKTPLIDMTKAEVVELGHELGVPLADTWSCIIPESRDQHCGECLGCTLRKKAFQESDVEDPTDYGCADVLTVEEANDRDRQRLGEADRTTSAMGDAAHQSTDD